MEDTIIVNIGRQLGSGGRQIGERIARRLNLRFYDRELLALAAEQSGLCTELFEKADEKESKGRLATLLGYLRGPFAGDDGGMTNVLSKVVSQGTGIGAAISGVQVAGKTGTAETGKARDDSWFVGFAPADDPQVVVAMVLEEAVSGEEGINAATKSRPVLGAALKVKGVL